MIEPVNVPIILDLELSQVEYDLSVEEAEEYAAQIGSLITISEVYGGLPSGGNAGEILIKNSNEDYDAIWGIIKNGANIWWTNHSITQGDTSIYTAKRYVVGRTDMLPEIHDFLVGLDIGVAGGTPNTLYEIIGVNQLVYSLKRIGNIGENDYNKLLNKPQIDGIEINKNSTSISLGLATASALEEKYTKPSGGIPASDLADDVHLIPAGGNEGQVLKKNSGTDYDVTWASDNWIETEYFDFTWDGDHNPVPAAGVTGEAIFDAIQAGKLVFARVTVGSSSYPYIFSLHAYYSNTYLEFVSIDGSIIDALSYSVFFGQGLWNMNEYIIPNPAYNIPADLGVAAVGSSETFARADHVHAMPSAADIGAYVKPNDGIPASDLASDVHLIPPGGTIGQVLRKISNSDWDINWGDLDVDGSTIWWTNRIYVSFSASETNYAVRQSDLNGNTGTPSVDDYVFGPSAGEGEIDSLFQISGTLGQSFYYLTPIATFSVTNDYNDLINKPSINNVTLSDNKSLSDLGIQPKDFVVMVTESQGTYSADKNYSAIGAAVNAGKRVVAVLTGVPYQFCGTFDVDLNTTKAVFSTFLTNDIQYLTCTNNNVWAYEYLDHYTKPSGGIPKTDLAVAVQSSLDKADTALQSAPVTSVNGQTGAVLLTIPSTASDVGAVAVSQGIAHAGEFVVVGSDGNITTVTMSVWQGGSY